MNRFINLQFTRNLIARRLTLIVVIFSLLATMVITVLQLINAYHNELATIQRSIQHIESSHLPLLAENVQATDHDQIQKHLNSMAELHGIEYLAIMQQDAIQWQSGAQKSRHVEFFDFPFTAGFENEQPYQSMLRVAVSFDAVYNNLIKTMLTRLLENSLLVLLIALLFLHGFHEFVGKHLYELAQQAAKSNGNTCATESTFTLNRHHSRNQTPDELDRLTSSLNHMHEKMCSEIAERTRVEEELRELNQRLEERSEERNRSLIMANNQLQREVAERRQTAKVLAANRALLQGFLDNSPTIMFAKDLEGRLILTNRQFGAFANVPVEQLIGKTDYDFYTHEKANQIRRADAHVLRTRKPYEIETVSLLEDGLHTYLTVKFPLYADDGHIFAIGGITTDITTWKQTQEELKQAKEAAEAASHSKSTFLANMSHELRTPLNAILGYSEMLLEEAQDLGYHDFQDDLLKIQTAGRHLLNLINDILDISKIEAGHIHLNPNYFDVKGMIDEVTTTVQPLIEKNSNMLQVLYENPPVTMYNDETKVRQILLNLLSNAAKFTTQGTITMHIRGERNQTNGRPKASSIAIPFDFVTFRLDDTGIGMTSEQVEHVFDAFRQGDESTTRKYGGTGLGLAISRHYCHIMGGDITAQSTLGKGTTFTVSLPREVPTAQEERALQVGE